MDRLVASEFFTIEGFTFDYGYGNGLRVKASHKSFFSFLFFDTYRGFDFHFSMTFNSSSRDEAASSWRNSRLSVSSNISGGAVNIAAS